MKFDRTNQHWNAHITRRSYCHRHTNNKVRVELSFHDTPTGNEVIDRGIEVIDWAFKSYYMPTPCPEPLIADLVRTSFVPEGKYRGAYYRLVTSPTVHGCLCGSCHMGEDDPQEMKAFLLKCASWGFMTHIYDNPPPPPKLCTCAADRADVKDKPWPCDLTEDTGYKPRTAGRCIVDYIRKITFHRNLTDEEREFVKRKIHLLERSPGNWSPTCTWNDNVLTLRTTHDSSD